MPCICENETFMALWNKNNDFTKAVKLKESLQTAIEHQGLLTPLYPNTEDINSEKNSILHPSELQLNSVWSGNQRIAKVFDL